MIKHDDDGVPVSYEYENYTIRNQIVAVSRPSSKLQFFFLAEHFVNGCYRRKKVRIPSEQKKKKYHRPFIRRINNSINNNVPVKRIQSDCFVMNPKRLWLSLPSFNDTYNISSVIHSISVFRLPPPPPLDRQLVCCMCLTVIINITLIRY